MNFPGSGFNKTLIQIQRRSAGKVVEKPSRGPLTKEESEQAREAFRAAARYLMDGIDGKDRR